MTVSKNRSKRVGIGGVAWKWVLLIVGGGLLAGRARAGIPAEATVTVRDEQGVSVDGANVSVSFALNDNAPPVQGLTDTNGQFHAGAMDCDGGAYFSAYKDGHYVTRGEFLFDGVDTGKWVPWNPIAEALLRPIENPVPMYARNVETTIPAESRALGYDLEAGDWTVPHGRGTVRDFLFTYTRRAESWDNFDVKLELTFSNPDDGIQEVRWPYKSYLGSVYRLPRFAPDDGYHATNIIAFGADPQKGYYNVERPEDLNYFFRVRTQTNDAGEVTNAWYGKLHGDFDLSGYGTDRSTLKFRYYVNPDGTRNMEFDPKRNLSRNLGRWEGVSLP